MLKTDHCVKNILLVYPDTPANTYWSFSHSLSILGKKAAIPPLGLLTVAALFPENGFSLRLVDMNVSALSDGDIEWADMIFVSAMIVHRESLKGLLKRLSLWNKPVVLGGPYPSTAYREIDSADCFFIGEAETLWPMFLEDVKTGSLKPAYAAPVGEAEMLQLREYFGSEAYIERADGYPDINLAPVPRFDLLRLNDYAVMPVQASRGCPVGCEFCDIWRRFGRRSRNKRPACLTAEMDALYRLGWRDSIFLVDDNFIGDKKTAENLLSTLAVWQNAHDRPFTFLTETTLSLADSDRLLKLMAQAGFTSVFVGIETPCEESLKETRKHINTLGSMAEKVAKIQCHGIQVMSGFIIGFDADPDDIARKMTDCIQDLGIPQAMIGLLNALPETDLYERLEREGRVRSVTTGNNTHCFEMNFEPVRPENRVLEDYKTVLEAAYPGDMKSYFRRCAVLRKHWPSRGREGRSRRFPLGWKIMTFAKYMAALLGSRYRFSALWFLISSLALKPSFFEEAVSLGIVGHHHWKTTREAFEVESLRQFMLERLRRLGAFLQSRQALLMQLPAGGRLRESASMPAGAESLRQMLREKDVPGDLKRLFLRAEKALEEVEACRNQMKLDAERKYRHLSQNAKNAIVSELKGFLSEVDRLCAGWGTASSSSAG